MNTTEREESQEKKLAREFLWSLSPETREITIRRGWWDEDEIVARSGHLDVCKSDLGDNYEKD